MEPSGRSGGLALYYMDSPVVTFIFSNKHVKDIEVSIEGSKVYMTFNYGDLIVSCHRDVWERITRMSLDWEGVWFITLLLGISMRLYG